MSILSRLACISFFATMAALPACSTDADGDGVPDVEEEANVAADEGAISSVVDCSRERMAAYQGGRSLGSMDVFMIGGKRVTLKTGHAFLKLQKAAHEQGVDVWINSGFRTMDEQTYFYNCYRTRRCNNGNKAARPGYSNHQHGRALDLGTSNRGKLNRIIREMRADWRNTVSGEDWHYEYFGPSVPGVCDADHGDDHDDGNGNGDGNGGNGGGGDNGIAGCFSPTLDKRVDDKVCVQGRTGIWYQCQAGSWEKGGENGTGPHGACAASHPR